MLGMETLLWGLPHAGAHKSLGYSYVSDVLACASLIHTYQMSTAGLWWPGSVFFFFPKHENLRRCLESPIIWMGKIILYGFENKIWSFLMRV